MELEYIKSGDYFIPNLTANNEPNEPLTKYGLMRCNFLKEHRTGVYSGMMLEGTLESYCLMMQKQAEERMDVLVAQMCCAVSVENLHSFICEAFTPVIPSCLSSYYFEILCEV